MQAIIDSHCHIDMVLEKGMSSVEITASLAENNVLGFIQIAADPKAIDFAQTFLKEKNDYEYYYTIGQHPGEVNEVDTSIGISRARAAKDDRNFVAIGEIGLDYFYGAEQKSEQSRAFSDYLDLALELDKPVCIHTRNAHEDTLRQLEKVLGKIDILIHCFTGNVQQLQDYLHVGCLISFSGIVTFKNARELQQAAIQCPLENILIETDAPFLTPTPFRGRDNHPAMVRHTLNFLAELRAEDVDVLAAATLENTRRFYRI